MRVVFSAQAKAGLRSIALYIARDNKARALSFVGELRQKATDISRNPLAYPLVSRFEDRRIRRRVFRDYLIFYRADADAVYIVHILHGAQDYEALLFPPA
jgi:plasmid stabilization system protein ParE